MSSAKKPRRRLFSAIHPRHPFWGPVIWVLTWLWRIVWYVWTTLIIDGLVSGAIVASATSGSTGLSAPSTWIVVRPLLAHPVGSAIGLSAAALLTFVAYLAHRWRTRVLAPAHPRLPPSHQPHDFQICGCVGAGTLAWTRLASNASDADTKPNVSSRHPRRAVCVRRD